MPRTVLTINGRIVAALALARNLRSILQDTRGPERLWIEKALEAAIAAVDELEDAKHS
jgi:hypothetical protein